MNIEEVINNLRFLHPCKFDSTVVNFRLSEVRRPRVRSELFAAISECNTLSALDLEECNLSPQELGILCVGLRSNPVLTFLKLSRNNIFCQETSCKSLAEVLRACAATLVVVELEQVNMDARGVSHLVRAWMDTQHSALQQLSLSGNDRLGDKGMELVAKLWASDSVAQLQRLSVADCGMTAAAARILAGALATNTTKTLRVLEVGMTRKPSCQPVARQQQPKSLSAIDALVSRDRPFADLLFELVRSEHCRSSLRRLTLGLWAPEAGVAQALCHTLPSMSELRVLSIVQPNLADSEVIKVLESLKKLRNLQELTLDRHVGLFAQSLGDHAVTRGLVRLLATHPLRILRVGALRLSQTDLRRLFESLLLNVNLETLDLQSCRSADGTVFDSLMHLLQVNKTLRFMNLADTPLEAEGKVATVEAALAQNAKTYVAVLRAMPTVPPRAGRIFLCGSPFAGKTTLQKSLVVSSSWMTTHKSKFVTALRHCLGCEINRRTRGVEVQLFIDERDTRISIWDMAGQEEYHALHDFIFPVVNHAYLFVFVFDIANPCHHRARISTINVDELRERFRNELTYWLFFVASNSKMSPTILPRMLVVLTHMDKARITPDGAKKWARETIADIAQLFADVVEVCEPIFAVDARTANDSIAELAGFLRCSFKSLLTERLNKVTAVCDEMARELAKWRTTHPTKPLLKKSSLKDSQNKLARLQCFGHTTPWNVRAAVEERRTAVNAYLNDVGEIINFEDLHYIVVNPHWFGRGILGQLIQVGEEQATGTGGQNNGFFRKSDLNMLLDISLHTLRMELGDLQTEDLVELMLKLELCYEVELDNPDSGYFVPATLAGKDKLCWPGNDLSCHGSPAFTYFGRRLECRDQLRTFLTLGFFPRLQAVLHNAYKIEVQDKKLEYKLQQNLIMIRYNGMDVFIEYEDEKRRHIDLLARYNGQYSNTEVGFVQELMNKIKSFTASEKGNQGVALVEGSIRPACVRRLTPNSQRAQHSVLVETLMENLHAAPNYPQYQHTWPQLDEVLDEPGENYALTLLGPSGPEMVFRKQRAYLQEVQGHLQIFISAPHQTNRQASNKVELRITSRDLGHGLSNTADNFGPQPRVEALHEYPLLLPPSPGTECCTNPPSFQDHRICGFMVDMKTEILSAVSSLSQTIMGVESRLTDSLTQIKVAIKAESDHIRRQQSQLQDELSKQLDQVIGFSVEQEERQLPRLLYLTREVRHTRRLLARLIPGSQAVRLHLMCEHPLRPHGVVGQPGYPMQLDDDTARVLRPLVVGTLKLVLMLAKVGAHIAAGIGNAIPDYADVGAALPVTVTGLAMESLTDDCDAKKPLALKKSTHAKVLDPDQQPRKEEVTDVSSLPGFWIRKVVREKILPNMEHLFLLQKCTYKDEVTRRVRWLCTKCKEELCEST